MTYLLLPSARLAVYQTAAKKVLITPLRAEQIISFGKDQHERVALAYQKTLSIINAVALLKGQIQMETTASFNKKLQGLSHNGQDTLFVSDKFGDIYSVSLQGQTKYLNSNLGIPTFLQRLAINGRSYIAVGDQDTRIKIYNQARMHEIKSFWFLTKKVPLQLLPATNNTLLLLLKRQQGNFGGEEEGAIEVHQLPTASIQNTQFSGELLFLSPQIQAKEECKYQTLVSCGQGNAYLLKLFSNRIKIVELALSGQKYKLGWQKSIVIGQGQWDSLYGSVDRQGDLSIAYGKTEGLQLETTTEPYKVELMSFENGWRGSINPHEHLLVVKL